MPAGGLQGRGAGMDVDHRRDAVRQRHAALGIDRRRDHDVSRKIALAFPVVGVFVLEHLTEIEMRQHAVALGPRMHAQLLVGAVADRVPEVGKLPRLDVAHPAHVRIVTPGARHQPFVMRADRNARRHNVGLEQLDEFQRRDGGDDRLLARRQRGSETNPTPKLHR